LFNSCLSNTLDAGRSDLTLFLTIVNADHRQVIKMAYDEGLSQSEIAHQLDIPLGTVKTWTRKGLLKLKQILRTTVE
jgi:RNA polymerase sigma-70 factor, ECF subfamily